jgi:hypothetical protein
MPDGSEPRFPQTKALDEDLERTLIADVREVRFEHVEVSSPSAARPRAGTGRWATPSPGLCQLFVNGKNN